MSKYLTISFVIIALILGIGVGYVLTPEYGNQEKMGSTEEMTSDKAFITAMIAHHEGALFMAEQAVKVSRRLEIQELASNIIEAQKKKIDDMYTWKKNWFNDTRKVEAEEKINLGEFDENFDRRFINAMVMHHMDAIDMAKSIQKASLRNEILNLADAVITAQMKEIEAMEEWRAAWYETDEDQAYLTKLIRHHLLVINVAQQAQTQSQRREVQELAATIVTSEQEAIEQLNTWRLDWYEDNEPVVAEETIQLGVYDSNFDLRFLNVFIALLSDAVDMAKDMKTKAMKEEIDELTTNVIAALPSLIEKLDTWRDTWYAVKTEQQFIDAVLTHHRSAIAVAKQAIALSPKQPIKDIAQTIIASQEAEMEKLKEWKKLWYNDTTDPKESAPIQLGKYDDAFDQRFLSVMIAHHLEHEDLVAGIEGIELRPEMKSLITALTTQQKQEMEQLKILKKQV